jgi:hypothetical protein
MRRMDLVAISFLILAGCQSQLGRENVKPGTSPAASASAPPTAAVAKGTAVTPASTPVPPSGPLGPETRLALGIPLHLVLATTASSDKSQQGDPVVAKLATPVKEADRVVLPAGTELRGEVLVAQGSGRVKGRARLAIGFMKIVVGAKTYEIQTSAIDATAAPQKGRDAKIIGGGVAAGALIGAIAGGGSGAAKGAAIGGAAGGGTVLATKGKEVVFTAGSRHTVTLKKSVTLD